MAWASKTALPGGCPFVAAAAEFDDRPGAVRSYLVSTQEDWIATLARAAEIAVQEGHFDENLDCPQFAYEMYALMLGGHHYHRLLGDPRALERARIGLDHLLERARA